jgi:hypothetical protein
MKKTIITLVTILFLGALTAQEKPTNANAPIIYFEKDYVDYGVVTKGSERIRKLKVTNKGNAPLIITNCDGSCGCTVPTCPREPIMPGKSAEIEVNYDTNRVEPINKTINIKSNDPVNSLKIIQIKGEVK